MLTSGLRKQFLLLMFLAPAAWGQPKLDLGLVTRIKTEAYDHSKVMDHLSWLSDVYGRRVNALPAVNRLARVLPGRRMGRWTAARDWSQQRASGIVGTVRAQLVGPAVVGRNGGATLRGVERYAAGLEREHQWPHRR